MKVGSLSDIQRQWSAKSKLEVWPRFQAPEPVLARHGGGLHGTQGSRGWPSLRSGSAGAVRGALHVPVYLGRTGAAVKPVAEKSPWVLWWSLPRPCRG